MRPLYRLRQGWNRLRVALRPGLVDDEPARRILSSRGWALFRRMSPGDRAHALCVWRALQNEGPLPKEVAAAALLHDVGKAGAGLTLPYRTVIVLLRALRPAWLERLGASKTPAWRRPFWGHLHHAEVGAVRCGAARCTPLTIALVRWHDAALDAAPEDPALRHWLPRLYRADDAC
jgi:hypothetical protein